MDNEYYTVIADKNELKWFFDHIVSPLENGESYMMCYSSRTKKMTEEEKKCLGVNKAEMFHTEVGKKYKDKDYTFEDFYSLVCKFETNKKAYITNLKKSYLDKTLVLYYYLNPCSEYAVAQSVLEKINVINKDLMSSAVKHSREGIEDSIMKLSTIGNHIKACHATNPSRKVWMDFDIDLDSVDTKVISVLREITLKFFKKGTFVFVHTAGGIHVLVRKESLNFNPHNYTYELASAFLSEGYKVSEIKKNDNCMVSLPGTLMYNEHITRVLNKDDFE